jgi:hypothetical protein
MILTSLSQLLLPTLNHTQPLSSQESQQQGKQCMGEKQRLPEVSDQQQRRQEEQPQVLHHQSGQQQWQRDAP